MSDCKSDVVEISARLRTLELRLNEINRQFQIVHERDAHALAEANRSAQMSMTHNRLMCLTLIKEMKQHVIDIRQSFSPSLLRDIRQNLPLIQDNLPSSENK